MRAPDPADPGPERYRYPSDTRQLVERSRSHSDAQISARAFWTALTVVVLAVALFGLILWWT